MKKIISIVATALCMLLCSNVASAITKAEQEAQAAVKTYLNSKGWHTEIDSRDNSVNFSRNNILYWITFQEKENGVLYTLHRKTIKMEYENHSKETNSRRVENAVIAANLMNGKFPFKTLVSGTKVEFVFPIIAATPADYTKVFSSVFNAMSNLQPDFDKCYDRAKLITDSIHTYWRENDTTQLVVPQANQPELKNITPNLTLSNNVDFRIINEKGEEITPYGQSIKLANLKFIQPQINVQAKKKGQYNIGMVIYTPGGKKLVPYQNALNTTETDVEVNTKPTLVELEAFGSKDGSFWEYGDYNVIFYEGDIELGTASFHVL